MPIPPPHYCTATGPRTRLQEAGFGREDGVILTRGQWTFTRAADGGAVLHGRLSCAAPTPMRAPRQLSSQKPGDEDALLQKWQLLMLSPAAYSFFSQRRSRCRNAPPAALRRSLQLLKRQPVGCHRPGCPRTCADPLGRTPRPRRTLRGGARCQATPLTPHQWLRVSANSAQSCQNITRRRALFASVWLTADRRRFSQVAQLLPNGTTARPDGYWEAVTLRSRARSEQAVGVTIFLDRATSLVAAVADSGALSQEEPAAGRLAACLLVVTYDVSSRKGATAKETVSNRDRSAVGIWVSAC